MALDLDSLWDFSNPALSEQRFREALPGRSSDDTFILQTQIARTYGLRGDFETARALLTEISAELPNVCPEAQVRYNLELGRTLCSAAHPANALTEEGKSLARAAYLQALELADAAHLDGLAIDALHMMAFVDTDWGKQIAWAERALVRVLASDQPAAKRWDASIRNNLGYALYQLGRLPEALDQFQIALDLRQKEGNPRPIRVARWMVAWTLRGLNRFEESIAIQLELEQAAEAAGEPSPFVFEELELLYRAIGNDEEAAIYAVKRAELAP